MKYVVITALFLFSTPVFSQVYKCKSQSGALSFSDKPCQNGEVQRKMYEKIKNTNWIENVKAQKESTISITEVAEIEGETIIKYAFESQRDSNDFVRLVSTLSKMTVELFKFSQLKNSEAGNAEVRVSNKPNKLFDNL